MRRHTCIRGCLSLSDQAASSSAATPDYVGAYYCSVHCSYLFYRSYLQTTFELLVFLSFFQNPSSSAPGKKPRTYISNCTSVDTRVPRINPYGTASMLSLNCKHWWLSLSAKAAPSSAAPPDYHGLLLCPLLLCLSFFFEANFYLLCLHL